MFDQGEQSEAEGTPSGGLPDGDFELLTDALRAGPGSPAWGQAVQHFGVGRAAAEFRQLLKARQRLEAGKSFRSIESTPDFKQTVLGSIAAEAATPMPQPHAFSSRTLVAIAAIAAAITLVVTGLVTETMLMQSSAVGTTALYIPPPRHDRTIKPTPAEAGMTTFDSIIPTGWRAIGSLRVEAKRGLRLAGGTKLIDQSGGIFWEEPLSSAKPFKVAARLHFTGLTTVSPEVFLTDDNTFDDDRPAERNHEFAWTVVDDRPQVRTADRTLMAVGDTINSTQAVTLAIDIKVDGPNATVDTAMAGHCTHWTGPHQLAADKPLWMGMRFVVHGSRHDDCVSVEAVRVATAR